MGFRVIGFRNRRLHYKVQGLGPKYRIMIWGGWPNYLQVHGTQLLLSMQLRTEFTSAISRVGSLVRSRYSVS